MARRVVLIISSDQERLQAWQRLVRRAGHFYLPAATISRALYLLRKIRPALVLADLQLSDGRALSLLREMHRVPALQEVPVVIRGRPDPDERGLLADHTRVYGEDVDDGTIGAALEGLPGVTSTRQR